MKKSHLQHWVSPCQIGICRDEKSEDENVGNKIQGLKYGNVKYEDEKSMYENAGMKLRGWKHLAG